MSTGIGNILTALRIAMDFKERKMRVSAISPGVVPTPRNKS
jgi:NAD(P)-dependent dehydrogenase (short-subunit alcohol dehydrogenase family)